MGSFGADGRGDTGADVAWRADVAHEFWMDFAELGDFVHGGLVDFFLALKQVRMVHLWMRWRSEPDS